MSLGPLKFTPCDEVMELQLSVDVGNQLPFMELPLR